VPAIAAGNWLLDTGPVVAFLSRADAAHEACVAAIKQVRGKLLTSEAVLAEAMRFCSRRADGAQAGLEFFLRAGTLVMPMTPRRLARCRELLTRYAEVPMDYADATLVTLAEDLGLGRVLTLDRRSFSTYCWKQNRSFVIAP